MRRNDRRAGFTLVEVLAALVVTAAFAAVVLPFAGRLASRWWVGETRVEAADGWMQAVARLGDDLAQAVPIVEQRGDAVAAIFTVGPDVLQFVRPALASSSRLRLETVRFDVRPSDRGHALMRRTSGFRPGSEPDFGAPSILLDGPLQLRFRAFADDHVPRATWADERNLPAGVELRAVSPTPGASLSVPVLLGVVAKAVTRKSVSVTESPQP